VLLVERGLAPSRERAQALVLAGLVRVDGIPINKSGNQVYSDADIIITGEVIPYVSRGGVKLAGALEDFGIIPAEKVCLDIGCSTGGFTDCLLQRDAARVFAVDVNTSQLDWNVQRDWRVLAIKKNARYLLPPNLPKPPSLVVMDVSFISVTKILPAIVPIAVPGADFLILIKPQFELERRDVGKGGIVRDPALHQKAVAAVSAAAKALGLEICGVRPSRLPGAEGNQEFFLHARRPG
jgi:23S rRNA (cytidine1920-2'-O)/16S rRNA (cytidine1409-2'-O)-methyltransferase